MHVCEGWCLWRPEASALPGAGLTGGCEESSVGAGN